MASGMSSCAECFSLPGPEEMIGGVNINIVCLSDHPSHNPPHVDADKGIRQVLH
jgi:hypothetical protein